MSTNKAQEGPITLYDIKGDVRGGALTHCDKDNLYNQISSLKRNWKKISLPDGINHGRNLE